MTDRGYAAMNRARSGFEANDFGDSANDFGDSMNGFGCESRGLEAGARS
jgi:hypothetical protein